MRIKKEFFGYLVEKAIEIKVEDISTKQTKVLSNQYCGNSDYKGNCSNEELDAWLIFHVVREAKGGTHTQI